MREDEIPMELKNKKINFLGDSITEGWGTTSVDKCFVSLIASEYGAVCRNYGVGGTRMTWEYTPDGKVIGKDFCSRAVQMDTDADAVIILGGTNDFHGEVPIGRMTDTTPVSFYGAWNTLCTYLTEKYLGKPIVIMTPLHRCNEDNPRGEDKPCDVRNFKAYINVIREIAEYYSFPLLDLYAQSGIQPRIPLVKETYMPDGLHPNDAGHALLAQKIASFLKSI